MNKISHIRKEVVVVALIIIAFVSGLVVKNIVGAQLAEAYTYSTLPSLDYNLSTSVVHTSSTSTTLSVHIGAANNQMLIVPMGGFDGGEDTSATFNGTSMTYGSCHGLGTEAYYGFWYILSPSQGTHDLVINYPSSSNRHYAAVVLDNVDQTTPFDTCAHVGGNGGNPSASVHTNQANDLVLYFLDYDDRSTNLIYTPNDDTLYFSQSDPYGNTYGGKGALHLQTTSATTSVGGTASGNGPWDLVAVPIRAANP